MTEKYVMKENHIPDGILHDRDLYNIALEDNVLVLSFNIVYYPENYSNSFGEKYKDFKKCHIRCKLCEDVQRECGVSLETALKGKNLTYKGILLDIEEFIPLANKEMKRRKEKGYYPWTYLSTSISPDFRAADIDLRIDLKYRHRTYTSSKITVDTEEIEFVWE